ncbi:MAG: hypothetical protein ACI9QC_000048 [Oceanicoccus sp.]|jgi:hypothetical protein
MRISNTPEGDSPLMLNVQTAIFQHLMNPHIENSCLWYNLITKNGTDLTVQEELHRLVAACLKSDRSTSEKDEAQLDFQTYIVDSFESTLTLFAANGTSGELSEGINKLIEERTALSRRVSELTGNARDAVLDKMPRLGRLLLGIAPVAFVGYFAYPYLSNLANQARFDFVSGLEVGARNGGTSTVDGKDLDGVSISFACVLSENEEGLSHWEPMNVQDKWTSQALEHPFFGVTFTSELGVQGSIVAAGWGTTIGFTPEQIDNKIPEAFHTKSYDIDGETFITLETAGFKEDMMSIAEGQVFTTGERSEDGYLTEYYLVGSDGDLACAGLASEGAVPYVAEATLKLQLAEKSLEYYMPPGEELTLSEDHKRAFAQYGLANWYESYYSGLAESLNITLANASSRGVKQEAQRSLVNYFSERTFEIKILAELNFLSQELDPEAFELIVENISGSATHLIDFTNTHELLSIGAAGLHHPGAAGSKIDLVSDLTGQQLVSTATHEYNHALIQGQLTKDLEFDDLLNEQAFFRVGGARSANNLLNEGMTEWLSLVGGGKVVNLESDLQHVSYTYDGRVNLVHMLYQAGVLNDLVKIYTGNPDTKLSEAHKSVITSWGFSMTFNSETQHLVSILFDVVGLENASSSDNSLQRGKQIYQLLIAASLVDDQNAEGRDEVTEIAETLSQLIQD